MSGTPILDALERQGVIWGDKLEWEGRERDWQGRASDGVVLSFGISTRAKLERYLREYPTPDKWLLT